MGKVDVNLTLSKPSFSIWSRSGFDGVYPMDYYAKNDKPWTNYFKSSKSLAAAPAASFYLPGVSHVQRWWKTAAAKAKFAPSP